MVARHIWITVHSHTQEVIFFIFFFLAFVLVQLSLTRWSLGGVASGGITDSRGRRKSTFVSRSFRFYVFDWRWQDTTRVLMLSQYTQTDRDWFLFLCLHVAVELNVDGRSSLLSFLKKQKFIQWNSRSCSTCFFLFLFMCLRVCLAAKNTLTHHHYHQ